MTPMAPQRVHKGSWVTGFNLATKRSVSCEVRDCSFPQKKWKFNKEKTSHGVFLRESPIGCILISVHFFQERFLGSRQTCDFFHGGCWNFTLWLLSIKKKNGLLKNHKSNPKSHVEPKNPWKILLGSKYRESSNRGGVDNTNWYHPSDHHRFPWKTTPVGPAARCRHPANRARVPSSWPFELLEKWVLNHLALVVYSYIKDLILLMATRNPAKLTSWGKG